MPGLFRLSLIFSIAGLLASRIGLLVHEFLGHGGVAYGLGGTVPHWRLFLFGGGWIQYERTPWYSDGEALAIALAGVAFEVLAAVLLWIASRHLHGAGSRLARLAALLLCAHACFYLVSGTHYGYGDGRALQQALESGPRLVLVVLLSSSLVVAAFVLAREGILAAASLTKGKGVRRVATTVVAILIASTVHGGLYLIERSLIDPDSTYEAIMEQELQRRAALHVAEVQAQRLNEGMVWTPADAQQVRTKFVETHKPWPITPVLGILCLVAASLALFFYRSTHLGVEEWRPRSVQRAGLLLGGLLATIATINSL